MYWLMLSLWWPQSLSLLGWLMGTHFSPIHCAWRAGFTLAYLGTSGSSGFLLFVCSWLLTSLIPKALLLSQVSVFARPAS